MIFKFSGLKYIHVVQPSHHPPSERLRLPRLNPVPTKHELPVLLQPLAPIITLSLNWTTLGTSKF